MFDATCDLSHPRSTRTVCDKYFSRRKRQHSDSDDLAYGYIHPDHIAVSQCKRTLSARRMYSQDTYGRPPPDRFYRNDQASRSYVTSDAPRRRPYRGPQAWASSSTLNIPSQPLGSHGPGWQSSPGLVSPPTIPPRPPPKHVSFGDRPSGRGKSQATAVVDDLASRVETAWANSDTRETAHNKTNEELWIEALDRELISVVDEEQAEPVTTDRSGKRNDASTGRSKTGLINYGKTWTFANSRLPPQQPPFRPYLETWRLVCKAARLSSEVYQRPQANDREYFVAPDRKQRTKAMVLKGTALDDKKLVVFSIRGSKTSYFDWDVNLHPVPTAPEGFLDDGGNGCHSGFLEVAKAMVAPAAARLRQLLEQDPSRCTSSLLITGHSAGGAVASLLYMHMLATTVESELTVLTGCFKRVHCITFGAPPVSFLPLEKPSHLRGDKSLFLSFVNEGDIVIRAEKAYLLSIAKLLAGSKSSTNASASALVKKASHAVLKSAKSDKAISRAPYWPVPEATLSNAGRIVLLREKPGAQRSQAVEAVVTNDEKLREVVFGDTNMHPMSLYQQRVETLAFAAMLGEDSR